MGELLAAGDPVGLSGNTGCSTGPHLHFTVWAENPQGVDFLGQVGPAVDAFGWIGEGEDPWLSRLEGGLNQQLWIAGEAPAME